MDAETSSHSSAAMATRGRSTLLIGASRDIVVCRRVRDGEVWISVAGVLDYATRDMLAVAVRDSLAERPGRLVVDLDQVRLLDASAIGTLLRMHDLAGRCHAGLRLANPHGIVREALKATGSLPVLVGSPAEANRYN
ncbi:STAS domain-containing protein [Dactylosporangium sp. NPDC051484]|uniref:STAS domain-containing protein n=1 Tax=Dactylosporangium sp. NPDC051484 TaxID=3154942 RepID=UPI00344F4519